MTTELKNIPALSYDLIEWLDKNIALPKHLQPGENPTSHVQVGGMRALIDQLVLARDQESSPDDVSDSDNSSGLQIGEDGQLPSVLGSGRILGPGTPPISVDIGESG